MNPLKLANSLIVLFALTVSAEVTHAAPDLIRINVDSLPMTLEPPLLTDTIAGWVLHHIGDRLIEEHQHGQLHGNLAASWHISEDRRTYRFLIASGRFFEDGSTVTAEAVANSFKKSLGYVGRSRVSSYLSNINAVTVENSTTVRIDLKEPVANFLQILSDASFTVYKTCATKLGFCFTSRDFKIKIFSKDKVEFVRRSDSQAFQLLFMSFDEALSKFKSGELEILRNYGIENLEKMASVKAQKAEMPDERTYFLAFNTQSKRFKDLANRRSFTRLFDRGALKSQLRPLGLRPTFDLLSPSLLPRSDSAGSEVGKRSLPPETVRPISDSCTIISIGAHRVSRFSRTLLAKTNHRIESLSKKDFLARVKAGNFDAVLMGYGVTVREWDYVSTLFHSNSLHNFAKLNDAEIDQFLERARSEVQPQSRLKLYRDILRLNHERLIYIPLFHTPQIFAFSKSVSPGFKSAHESITTPFFSLSSVRRK